MMNKPGNEGFISLIESYHNPWLSQDHISLALIDRSYGGLFGQMAYGITTNHLRRIPCRALNSIVLWYQIFREYLIPLYYQSTCGGGHTRSAHAIPFRVTTSQVDKLPSPSLQPQPCGLFAHTLATAKMMASTTDQDPFLQVQT